MTISNSKSNSKSSNDSVAYDHDINHNMPSRWYTVLALPFPDQRIGRRDIISTYGRRGGSGISLTSNHQADFFSSTNTTQPL